MNAAYCTRILALQHVKNFELILQGSLFKNPSKNKRIPLKVTRTRYSLVKGERIVRFVLITRFRDFFPMYLFQFIALAPYITCYTSRCGTRSYNNILVLTLLFFTFVLYLHNQNMFSLIH